MSISPSGSSSFPHYSNRDEYRHDLEELKNAGSYDSIMIDENGHLHCVGVFSNLAQKFQDNIGSLFGGTEVVQRELNPEFLKAFLRLGSAEGWLDSSEIKEIASKFKDYNSAASDAKASLTFDKSLRPEKHKAEKEEAFSETASVASSEGSTPYSPAIARNIFVRPSQIKSQLENYLLESFIDTPEMEVFAYALCREINEVSLENKLKPGESYKIEANTQTYKFQFHDVNKDEEGHWQVEKQKPTEITIPFDCWVELSKDGKSVNLLFRENEELAAGGFKTVFKAQKFDIHLEVDTKAQRKIDYSPKIIFKDQGDPETILEGLAVHKKLLETVSAAGAKIVELPKFPVPRSEDDDSLEMEQKWYNSTLAGASETGLVPLDIQENSKERTFTPEDSVSCMMNVVSTLSIIHAKGVVHRDVKNTNILLALEKKKIKGLLADLDLIQELGGGDGWKYVYWDKSSQNGWVMPLSDCYGMAMTLGESWVPDFEDILNDTTQLTPQTIAERKSEAFVDVMLKKLVGNDPELFDQLKTCESKQEIITEIDSLLAEDPSELTDDQKFILENLKQETVLLDFLMANRNATMKTMLGALDALMKDPANGLSEEQRKSIREIKKGVVQADFALDTALQLIKDSDRVYNFLKDNEKLRNALLTKPEDLVKVPEKKREETARKIRQDAALKIQQKTSYTTAKNLEENLRTLQAKLKSL